MPRPTVALLDRPTIARAALEMLDTDKTFTMPGLAKKLGVAVSSLYHHVNSREELMELLRTTVAGDLNAKIDWKSSWDDVIRQWLIGYRDALGAHPELIRELTTHTISAPAVLEAYNALAGVLSAAGFADARVIHVIALLDMVALGGALDAAAPADVWSIDASADDGALARSVRSAPQGRQRVDTAFTFAIDTVLAGLRHDLDASVRR
ncbi:TetR/AcrR family transcriptional regulator [Williamsia sterculiae]|uniref:Transcriptional regulator, TetR family n=1 Tax=Williamsia sterculiae TaxID=1344003 RepID=A0A1N7EQE8_9NOCA|nr:TetR/AcrR family transcriptional regulator C-terminal domain-containing protein [Williamsia sterculiae]SIR90328.1 transcriptional regulator, TetR family [Williamsia sterculiae]